MNEVHDPDDATFKLATGEELVLPGEPDENAANAAPSGVAAAGGNGYMATGSRPVARPTWLDRRTAGRLRARKVRRLVRHVEPWSVLKVALIFYFCLWVILLIAGVMLWSLAVTSGTIDNVEKFITELFALESFTFNADQIFQASAIGGLVLVVAGSGFTVLMAVLFNLISDITGGVRLTVVEEETARARPKRLRPRSDVTDRLPASQRAQPLSTPADPGLVAAPSEFEQLSQAGGMSTSESETAGADVPILATAESTESGQKSDGSAQVANGEADR